MFRREDEEAGSDSAVGGRGLLSYLSLQGVGKLTEGWGGYSAVGRRRNRRRGNAASLFVSRSGEYVAMAVGNRIVILRKDDGYKAPHSIYTNNDRMAYFTNGAWMEAEGIFGVLDDLSTLYLIKENGEEITRRTIKQLKLSSPIIYLVVQDGSSPQRSSFYIFTSYSVAHKFDYTREPEASLNKVPILIKDTAKTSQLPRSLSCLDCHQDRSFIVLVGDSTVSSSSNGYSEVAKL